jgi:hypothetical protein
MERIAILEISIRDLAMRRLLLISFILFWVLGAVLTGQMFAAKINNILFESSIKATATNGK